MTKERMLKRVVTKEELVMLTGDDLSAVILNQFLYWSERTKDFDQFIKEEKTRDPQASIMLTRGWIYKSADDLRDEIMTRASSATVRRRIVKLVNMGWLRERHNPNYGWDRVLQYRPDIHKIQTDLLELGYVLAGYPLQIEKSILHGAEWNLHGAGALPEITTERDDDDGRQAAIPSPLDLKGDRFMAYCCLRCDRIDMDSDAAMTYAQNHDFETIRNWCVVADARVGPGPGGVRSPAGFVRSKLDNRAAKPRAGTRQVQEFMKWVDDYRLHRLPEEAR